MKKIFSLLTLAVMSVMLTSCFDNDGPHYDPAFIGPWETVSYVKGNFEYPITPASWHRYVFYRDGTGYYEQDDLRTQFFWDEIGPDRIEMRHSDGVVERRYWDVVRGELLLSQSYDFYDYYVYR